MVELVCLHMVLLLLTHATEATNSKETNRELVLMVCGQGQNHTVRKVSI